MIHFGWGIAAFLIGGALGIFVTALMVAAKDDENNNKGDYKNDSSNN